MVVDGGAVFLDETGGPPGAAVAVGVGVGVHGAAAVFAATDARVDVPATPATLPTDAFTISAWLRPDAQPALDARMGVVDRPGEYGLFVVAPGVPRCTAGAPLLDAVDPLPLGAWSHVSCTYDGAGRALYVDGVLVASVQATSTFGADAGDVAVGANAPAGDAFVGAIDEVRIWTRVRTATELCWDAAR